ncbi:MAG TPA: hypothetical protein PLM09_05990 [Casimicrobiaceae bacterium]|nr:hypothetical protein [Casimicrobiaceae bacterium]
MAIVRLLAILGLGLVGVALVLYVVTRDRRYLTFVRRVAMWLAVTVAAALAWVVVDHLRR